MFSGYHENRGAVPNRNASRRSKVTNPPPPAGAAPDVQALMAACRGIVATEGLRGLSLRTAAKAANWTMGELNYRIGAKQQLFDGFFAFEREHALNREEVWLHRLAALPRFDAALLANVITGYLDDAAMNHREAAICWHELLIEAGVDNALRGTILPWLDDRELFWRRLLRGRFAAPETTARVIADYVAAEQIYSVALANEPWYRLVRMAGVTRLCSRSAAADDEWNNLFLDLDTLAFAQTAGVALGKQARTVARAAARLIVEHGTTAITHRAVAAALGQTASAVFHHFNTSVDLVSAGFQSLYEDVQSNLLATQLARRSDDEPSPPDALRTSDSAGVGFVRAMHFIALAGVRDANFRPLMARERAVRGRLISAWFGDAAVQARHYDRLSLQVISIAAGGRTLRLAASGHPEAGNSAAVLSEIFPETA